MKHLNWFLGPKGENSEYLIGALTKVLQDYVHWRRNYFPSDKILIDNKVQRENVEEFDKLDLNLMEMMSELRRNFPFYSPRYIGHMLSDITMPATIGYVAGMLYNSNNVTPEAAPVTVEWEVEACNSILEMLGFKASPTPPSKEDGVAEWKIYQRKLREEFGWAHITSGGTVANIEALWVARIIKYYPLAIRDVAIKENLDLIIKMPNDEVKDIKLTTEKEILFIKPNESIYLLSKFITSICQKNGISVSEANALSAKLIGDSDYSPTSHLGKIFNQYEPVVFCSGAAHYSIKKAADILGIGRSNVIQVKTDSQFRMDIKDLKIKFNAAVKKNKIPVAVIAVAATTEEGAVDPIHQIIDLRDELEKSNLSFWLHIDSAWGGYISSVFKLDSEDELEIILNKICVKLNVNIVNATINEKISSILEESLASPAMSSDANECIIELLMLKREDLEKRSIDQLGASYKSFRAEQSQEFLKKESKQIDLLDRFFDLIDKYRGRLNEIRLNLENGVWSINDFVHYYKKLSFDYGSIIYFSETRKLRDILEKDDFLLTLGDRSDLISNYVSDKINFSLDFTKREKVVKWGGKPIVSSFLAFSKADSITIDPHKLGYIQYPCGVVAFKNDRVRHFIMQRAPYITSSGHNALIHTPPRHIKGMDFEKIENDELPYNDYQIAIDAFAPFMLEGSKPGAAAASLWFSCKTIPLNRRNHGLIIRESLIATRELYEWLNTWAKIYSESGITESLKYDFKTFAIPDTNVLVFAIKGRLSDTLEEMNKLTTKVYEDFSIQAELGSKEHSYSQSFFLSKTVMDEEYYQFDSFVDFFSQCGSKHNKRDYLKHGLVILRATVMNPYISEIRRKTKQNLIKEFVWELHKSANRIAVELLTR